MNSAFILRFQEKCTPAESEEIRAGTMTFTKDQSSEQADSDPRQASYHAVIAGTSTNTRVATEQADKDCRGSSTAIPRHVLAMATKTMTFVESEMADNDPGRIDHGILARCS